MTVPTTSPVVAEVEVADALTTLKRNKKDKRNTCLQRQLHKTRLCEQFFRGRCSYGSECSYAHSCSELRESPNLKSTKLCINFKKGLCEDPNCGFAHTEENLRATHLFLKTTLCKWFEKGHCPSGDECRFAHGESELRPAGENWMETTDGAQRNTEAADVCIDARAILQVKESITKSKQSNKQSRKRKTNAPCPVGQVEVNRQDSFEPVYVEVPCSFTSGDFQNRGSTSPAMVFHPSPVNLPSQGVPAAPGLSLQHSLSQREGVHDAINDSSWLGAGPIARTRLASRVAKGSRSQIEYLQKRAVRANATPKPHLNQDTSKFGLASVEALIDGMGSPNSSEDDPSLDELSEAVSAALRSRPTGLPLSHCAPYSPQPDQFLACPFVPGSAPYETNLPCEFHLASEKLAQTLVAMSQAMPQTNVETPKAPMSYMMMMPSAHFNDDHDLNALIGG